MYDDGVDGTGQRKICWDVIREHMNTCSLYLSETGYWYQRVDKMLSKPPPRYPPTVHTTHFMVRMKEGSYLKPIALFVQKL